MFGKHQLSQRTKSLFPQPAFLSPCRMPGAVKYRIYFIALPHLAALSRVPAVTEAELGLKLPVLALWGHWGHAGGSHMLSLPPCPQGVHLCNLPVPIRDAMFLWHCVPVCAGHAVLMFLMASLARDSTN